MMKRVIPLIGLSALIFVAFLFRTQISDAAYNILYKSPCDTPIKYSIGTIDDRFGLTGEEVREYAAESQNVWNQVYHKFLLKYDPDSDFHINLVYDGRQKLSSQINSLNDNLKQQDNSLKPEIADYEKRVEAFKSKLSAFNQEVDDWNRKGGAPPEVYKSLIEQQKSLNQEGDSLNQEAARLNQSAQAYNTEVQQLNQTINNFNSTLHFKPEEGLYTQVGTKRKIDIYFYNSRDEFVHTLTHEMGHALGMNHVQDQEAIMFAQTNDALMPTQTDLSQLSEVCSKKNVVLMTLNNIILTIRTALNPYLTLTGS